ncbi:MAG: tripartite tricarboxylate transporter substrate binding protein [Rhodospirillales bacterium]|nr:tripartite tricarboxylate transporter substrate binding protein [Rhodospirillales bacterium]QQS11027.1 MAG: tripartite tricarboxylate transporter substrate binding protein [Rhodospirillales bacterium]
MTGIVHIRRRGLVAGAGALLAAPSIARAQDAWPKGQIRFVVPFPPGGSTDPVARILAAKLQESLGWNIIVDNKPGGTGVVGASFAAKAPPDGQTWLVVFDNHILNSLFTPDVPYKDSDLFNVMQIGRTPQGIGCHPDRPYKSFADVIADCKKRPGKVAASVLAASQALVLFNQMQKDNGYEMNIIPYKGGGPLLADALAGHTDLAISSLTAIAPHFAAGKLRPIAVTSDKRSPLLPDVPTLIEQGVKAAPSYSWWGVYAPKGTPRPIVDRMHAELLKAARSADVSKKFVDQFNMEVLTTTPEQFAEFQAKEQAIWGKTIRDNNLKPE